MSGESLLHRLFAVLIGFVLLGAPPAHSEELRPQLDDLVRHFGQVVFGDEYGMNTGPK